MAPCPAWESCPCLCPGKKGHPRDGCVLLFSWDKASSRREERIWCWGQTQAVIAGLPLTSWATLGKFLKPSSSESQFLHLESGYHGIAFKIM